MAPTVHVNFDVIDVVLPVHSDAHKVLTHRVISCMKTVSSIGRDWVIRKGVRVCLMSTM